MAVTSEVDSNPQAEAEAKRKPSLNKTNIEHFCQHFRWFKDAASIKKTSAIHVRLTLTEKHLEPPSAQRPIRHHHHTFNDNTKKFKRYYFLVKNYAPRMMFIRAEKRQVPRKPATNKPCIEEMCVRDCKNGKFMTRTGTFSTQAVT